MIFVITFLVGMAVYVLSHLGGDNGRVMKWSYCPHCKRNMTVVPVVDENGKSHKYLGYYIACASISTDYTRWNNLNQYTLAHSNGDVNCPVFFSWVRGHQKIIFPGRYAPRFCDECHSQMDKNDKQCTKCNKKPKEKAQ